MKKLTICLAAIQILLTSLAFAEEPLVKATENLSSSGKCALMVDWVSAVLTLIVIIVAIWGERIRQLWTTPKLHISLDSSKGVLNSRNDQKKAQYYILNVENTRRSSPAKNVRVLLTNIFKQTPDRASWQEMSFSRPVHATWRWVNIVPPYTTIGPKEQSTFGYVVEGEQHFSLQLYWHPNNLDPKLPAKEPFRLEFQAVSDVAESNILLIEIAWDGQWKEGNEEMQKHLTVKRITT